MINVWKMKKRFVEIIDCYQGTISGIELADEYNIEFYDEKDDLVDGRIDKIKFSSFPYTIELGSLFIIVVWRNKEDQEIYAESCPVMYYWDESWNI